MTTRDVSEVNDLTMPSPGTTGPKSGVLLMIGGNPEVPEIKEAARRLSRDKRGRTRWVWVGTAMPPGEREAIPSFIAESGDYGVIETHDRVEANGSEIVDVINSATALYFSGGRHYRLVDTFRGTRAEEAFWSVLGRDGLVAGNSAGATVQGSYLFRGHPSDDYSILLPPPEYEQAFGYLANAAVDQHVIKRERKGNLSAAVRLNPRLLGIGIEEGGGAGVRGNTMEVIGTELLITDGTDRNGFPYYSLPKGARFDLATRKRL